MLVPIVLGLAALYLVSRGASSSSPAASYSDRKTYEGSDQVNALKMLTTLLVGSPVPDGMQPMGAVMPVFALGSSNAVGSAGNALSVVKLLHNEGLDVWISSHGPDDMFMLWSRPPGSPPKGIVGPGPSYFGTTVRLDGGTFDLLLAGSVPWPAGVEVPS